MSNFHSREVFQNWKKYFIYQKTNLGLTNHNYILESGDEQFLLRQSSPKTIFFIQRANEIKVLKLIKDQKINTPVIDYFFDKEQNFIYISRFLEGAKNFAQIEKTPHNLAKAAHLIKKLHRVDYQKSEVTQLNMTENITNHINLSKYDGKNLQLNHLIAELKTFLSSFDWTKEIVLSHNDPLKENFLVDKEGNWYLIDYEYCSLNSSYYDIAVFASANALVKSPQLWRCWLNLFAITTKQEEKTLLFFVLYRDILGYFWAKCMHLHSGLSVYEQLMAKKLAQSNDTFQLIKKLTTK